MHIPSSTGEISSNKKVIIKHITNMKALQIIGIIILSLLIVVFAISIISTLLNNQLGAAMWGVAFIILCCSGIVKIWNKMGPLESDNQAESKE